MISQYERNERIDSFCFKKRSRSNIKNWTLNSRSIERITKCLKDSQVDRVVFLAQYKNHKKALKNSLKFSSFEMRCVVRTRKYEIQSKYQFDHHERFDFDIDFLNKSSLILIDKTFFKLTLFYSFSMIFIVTNYVIIQIFSFVFEAKTSSTPHIDIVTREVFVINLLWHIIKKDHDEGANHLEFVVYIDFQVTIQLTNEFVKDFHHIFEISIMRSQSQDENIDNFSPFLVWETDWDKIERLERTIHISMYVKVIDK